MKVGHEALGRSSKPTTAAFPGTESERAASSLIAPIAVKSVTQNRSVGFGSTGGSVQFHEGRIGGPTRRQRKIQLRGREHGAVDRAVQQPFVAGDLFAAFGQLHHVVAAGCYGIVQRCHRIRIRALSRPATIAICLVALVPRLRP